MDEADREIARLTRIAEETKEHISETQWYNMDEQPASRDALPIFRPTGAATPAHSHTGSDGPKPGKDCDAEVDIKGWPSINAFRVWKLAFKKAIASTSRRSKLIVKLITEVELAKLLEGLADSGDCEELDAKLSKASDDILQGEFKKKVQVKVTE